MKIPLIDLQRQYRELQDELLAAAAEVLGSGRYILGPQVRALEEEIAGYCGADHAVAVANGTDALVLTLDALGIGPGDEVITTPFTFFATAEAISRTGALPVFVDIDPATYNIDPAKVEEQITPATKAIIPVHLFGRPAEMEPLHELAARYGLRIIEDACQAIGATYRGRKAGSLGYAACFSFFPTKNLGAFGDAGMVVTDSSALAAQLRVLRAHGSERKYYHGCLGYNSRLDELQAAMLRVKLRRLDDWNARRRRAAALYNELLSGTPLITPAPDSSTARQVYHLYVVRSAQRDRLRRALQDAGIGCGVYYPLPLHRQEVYRRLPFRAGPCPEAEKAAGETLALPLFPEITPDEIAQVVKVVKQALALR